MMNHGRKRPVSLEDLLRLKRAERPPAEFWNQFDRELRAKQLAALVEKRPWWREWSFGRAFSVVRRYHLPLGAAAILAVTVLSVRNYHPTHSAPLVGEPHIETVATVAAPVASSVAVAVPVAEVTTATPAPAVSIQPSAVSEVAAVSAMHAVELATPEMAAQPAAHFAAWAAPEEAPASLSPSARLIAENLASTQVADFSRQVLTSPRGFESRAMPARAKPVEPLAQIRIPSSRRASMLAAAIPVLANNGPVLTSDRSALSLSDERLYDTVTRVSARGAGVAVKF
jgi:hypothetical protein